MEDNTNVNAAILERLEKVVQSLQENSVKMGQLLAVHNEKLEKQDRIDAVLFEKIETLLIASISSFEPIVALFSFCSGITLLKSGKLSLIILVIVVVLFSVTSMWFSLKFI